MKVELDKGFELGKSDQTPEFKKKFPLGKVPVVELRY